MLGLLAKKMVYNICHDVRELIKHLFIPEFLKWTLPFLNLVKSTDENKGQLKIKNRMANSVDPEQSHLDLHCLCKYMYWSAGLKELCM